MYGPLRNEADQLRCPLPSSRSLSRSLTPKEEDGDDDGGDDDDDDDDDYIRQIQGREVLLVVAGEQFFAIVTFPLLPTLPFQTLSLPPSTFFLSST